MQEELLRYLERITEEERELLSGGGQVRKNLYTSGDSFTIDSKKMLANGKLIDIRTHTRFAAFPAHKHNYIEIMYMCRGSTTHIINGRERVELRAGDLLFLNQHCSHEILPAGQNDLGINFIVLPEFLHLAFDMMEEENVLSNFIIDALTQDTRHAAFLHFEVSDVLPVQNLVENLVWMLIHPQGDGERLNQITMGLLFLQLLGHTGKISCPEPAHFNRMLSLSALRYIEKHFRTGSLGELAEQLNQSVSGLSRLIKENTGNTFTELIQMKRFEKAAALICGTRLPLTDIISAVGYENTSHFYRTFREKYGVSPREYRVQHAKFPDKKERPPHAD